MSPTDRLDRERQFHDVAYEEQSRADVGWLYAVNDACERDYEETLERFAGGGGRSVLEYGCGEGSLAFTLAEWGNDVTGIDISAVAIAHARNEAAVSGLTLKLDFKEMNAEDLAVPGASYDVVCGSGILHHLGLDSAYGEIARVLRRNGGRAVFTEPLGHNPAINLYRRLTPELRTPDEHPLRMVDLTLARRYFGTVEVRFYTLLALAALPLARFGSFERVLRTLQKVDTAMFRNVPPLERFAWYCVMELADPL